MIAMPGRGPGRDQAEGKDADALLTSQQLARKLTVSQRSVQRWVTEGILVPTLTLPSGSHRFDLEDAKRQLREHGRR
jgi:predicted site-specific integrase-resolvase